jgi:hypothetical protein
MGATQHERLLAALKPGHFLIDERTEQDLIYFVHKLSASVRFYDAANCENGDWSQLFAHEPTSILVELSFLDIDALNERFTETVREAKATRDIDGQREMLFTYFNTITFNKIAGLDRSIPGVAFLQGLVRNIEDKIARIKDVVSSEPPLHFLSGYQFNQYVQQLFGLLRHLKLGSKDGIARQLQDFPAHAPQYALFLAFLKLLNIAKDNLNTFTRRHLDFYYKEFLQIKPAQAVPDYVHLIIQPSLFDKPFAIPKGTIFPAGKNPSGQNRYYAATADHIVNHAALGAFYSSTASNVALRKADLFEANKAGAPFNVFTQEAVAAETGLLIASPLFYLSSGDRYIHIRINGQDVTTKKYDIYITSDKECIQLIRMLAESSAEGNLNYLHIPATAPKIVAYNPEIHANNADLRKRIIADTGYPVLKIVPKTPNTPALLQSISVRIRVVNFKGFIVGTAAGMADLTKPFKPFGDFPRVGNNFIIGANEFFLKKNADLAIIINPELDLPSAGQRREAVAEFVRPSLRDVMPGGKHAFLNQGIAANPIIQYLQDGKWTGGGPFEGSYHNVNPITEFQAEEKLPDNSSVNGYIKITFHNLNYSGEKFLQDYIAAGQTGDNVPVAPTIDSISLDYSVREDISYTGNAPNPGSAIEACHILPYGFRNVTAGDKFPYLQAPGGEICLGFEHAAAGDSLSLLFQLAEGTANPRQEPARISWQYVSGNGCILFKPSDVGDETNGLTQSGLVRITIPQYDAAHITILPAPLFWIVISVDRVDAICRFIGVHTQALKAVLTDFEGIKSQFTEHLPKDTISKLNEPVSAVKKVIQPYPSFGGKRQEDDILLYQRSSERLRHKNRAITSWDYERLILQEFPEVYRVKCLNHYRYDPGARSGASAGYITLIPIAKSTESRTTVSWRPLLSLGVMARIRKYVSAIASPHARILVKTPSLEKIELNITIKYRETPGADTRLYADTISQVINKYLSPWAFEPAEIQFAQAIEISALVALIDNQPFVDYIMDLKAYRRTLDDSTDVVSEPVEINDKISPSTDFTLFIPNDNHRVTMI